MALVILFVLRPAHGRLLAIVLHSELVSRPPFVVASTTLALLATLSASYTNLHLDPGFCNTNLRMIHVTVDMSLPENQNPQPELEENEFIETFSVPLNDLYDECIKFAEQGYVIDARVGTLAEGIEFAKRWRLA